MDTQTDIWAEAAEKAWQAVLEGVTRLRDSGMKLEEICAVMGVKSKAQMSEWLSGGRTAVNAPFGCMLRYLATLDHNPRDFVPSTTGEEKKPAPKLKAVTPLKNCATCRKLKDAESRAAKLSRDLEKLRLEAAKELSRRDGQIDLLKEQLAEAQGRPQSGEPPAQTDRQTGGPPKKEVASG